MPEKRAETSDIQAVSYVVALLVRIAYQVRIGLSVVYTVINWNGVRQYQDQSLIFDRKFESLMSAHVLS